jgi:two-component system sensor histidine kinase RegB
MSVIANEITREGDSPKVRADAALLGSQIEICRRTLDDLMTAAGQRGAVGGGRERLDRFLDSIASQCATMHPEARVARDWTGITPPPEILSERGLRQALLCLLNNAAEASPHDVSFSAVRRGDAFEFSIRDRGRGVNARDLTRLGRTFFTTKPPGQGVGLGLVLSTRAVERLGGTVSWANQAGRGVCAQVRVPAAALQLEEPK